MSLKTNEIRDNVPTFTPYANQWVAGESSNFSSAPPAWLPVAIIAGALVWAAIIVGVL